MVNMPLTIIYPVIRPGHSVCELLSQMSPEFGQLITYAGFPTATPAVLETSIYPHPDSFAKPVFEFSVVPSLILFSARFCHNLSFSQNPQNALQGPILTWGIAKIHT